jgi:hypothetical protein
VISADTARKNAELNRRKLISQELKEIEELINTAIAEGTNEVYIYRQLKKDTIEHLKTVGYEVQVGGRYNDIDTYIKW